MRKLDSRALFYRFAAPLAALAVFFAMSRLYLGEDKALYFDILRWWGVKPFRFPFADISVNLAAWQCSRHGIDVVLWNPCDVLKRPYVYSPLWMAFRAIPLGVKDTPLVGSIIDFLFLLSLGFLPRPRRPFELALVLAATLSTMVAFAVERANFDVVLFLMVLASALLAEGRFAPRLLGYGVALFAALLKYYPIMALVILFRERTRRFIAISLSILAILIAFLAAYRTEIAEGMAGIPHGSYLTDMFGARNLPFFLGQLAGDALASAGSAGLAERLLGLLAYAFLLGAFIAICRRLLRWQEFRDGLGRLAERERVLLVTGSSIIAGCFFAGQSVGYRGVYFLLVLPGLLAAARGAADARLRPLLIGASAVIGFLMWEEFFRLSLYRLLDHSSLAKGAVLGVEITFFVARELAWWWVVAAMAAILADFLLRSEVVFALRRFLPRPAAAKEEAGSQSLPVQSRRGL